MALPQSPIKGNSSASKGNQFSTSGESSRSALPEWSSKATRSHATGLIPGQGYCPAAAPRHSPPLRTTPRRPPPPQTRSHSTGRISDQLVFRRRPRPRPEHPAKHATLPAGGYFGPGRWKGHPGDRIKTEPTSRSCRPHLAPCHPSPKSSEMANGGLARPRPNWLQRRILQGVDFTRLNTPNTPAGRSSNRPSHGRNQQAIGLPTGAFLV